MNKKYILSALNDVYQELGIIPRDVQLEDTDRCLDIDILTKDEAIMNGVDEPKSFYLADDDNREILYYLIYCDHPDYCFIFNTYTVEDVKLWIKKWFKEIGIQ
jgi:hypothetical protein